MARGEALDSTSAAGALRFLVLDGGAGTFIGDSRRVSLRHERLGFPLVSEFWPLFVLSRFAGPGALLTTGAADRRGRLGLRGGTAADAEFLRLFAEVPADLQSRGELRVGSIITSSESSVELPDEASAKDESGSSSESSAGNSNLTVRYLFGR